MKILLTMQSLDETWGGIGIYTGEIVRALLQKDTVNQYFLAYPGFGYARKHRGSFRRFKNATEIETDYSRVPSGFYWDQVVIPKVARELGVDVLFNPFLSVPIRGKFAKVMVMHNVEYHTVPSVYDYKMYARWFLLEKVILPAADRVISISRAMTEDFRKSVHYPIEKVRTIYHGVSERFHPIKDELTLKYAREEYQLPEKYVLFVGHLYPQKNFAVLARALKRIEKEVPHQLVVAGRPRWKADTDLRLIEELGLKDRVVFLHNVPNRDLPAIYTMAECFVYPSFYESFGLAQLEAMACECPVIGARSGAIPEVAGDAAVLFDPRDDEELAETLLRTILDPQFRESYVIRGRARAKEFTWESTAEQTLGLFQELVAPVTRTTSPITAPPNPAAMPS